MPIDSEVPRHVQTAVDRAVGARVGGIEKQLDEVRALLTRMVLVEERQTNYKADNERLRKDVDELFSRIRVVETENAVQDTKGKHIDQILWKVISGVLAAAVFALEFFRR